METNMKITWLGQGGVLLRNDRITVIADPYFSDSVGKINPAKKRRYDVPDEYFDLKPDVILITHEHMDHLDTETLKVLLNCDRCVTVLAPEAAYNKLSCLGGNHNYVLLSPHSVWNEKGVTFYSVKAEHSDRTAAGFILDDGDKTYYISGDTLYNFDVIDDVLDLVEDGVDVAFLPINGRGNNMNAKDAADFAYEIGARRAVPVHYGLVDNISPDEFDFDDALILSPFEEVEI